MPLDVRFLRKDMGGDPDFWRENQRKRFCDPKQVDVVLEYDQRYRSLATKIRDLKKDINAKQKIVGQLKKKKEDATAQVEEVVAMRQAVVDVEKAMRETEKVRDFELGKLANILDETVPVSNDEADNRTEREWGTPRKETDLLHHHELLYKIGGYEPERGSRIAGHRGYFLTGPGVKLNMALQNYGTQFAMEHGYNPVQPPYFMDAEIMGGVAQLSEFDEALYSVHTGGSEEKVDGDKPAKASGAGAGAGAGAATSAEQSAAARKKYLIATSEQPLCAYHAGDNFNPRDLPIKLAGVSTCFRKEAGSSGRDAWGIFRVHQFDKVEQFVISEPSKSQAAHEEMVDVACAFYQSLGLPYRVVNIASGELNNAAAKKLDLEAWFPTLAEYRELVSASNCTDYQSRAMNIGFGMKSKEQHCKPYVHMLNATLCAQSRTICCILENYQTERGIQVPPVLVPFMGGQTFLEFVRESPFAVDVKKTKSDGGAKDKKAAGGEGKGKKAAGGEGKGKGKKAAGGEGKKKPATAAAPAPAPAAAPAAASPAPAPAARAVPAAVPRVVPAKAAVATASAVPSLAELNTSLASASYVTGYTPSKADVAAFNAYSTADTADFPNVARWVRHVASFSEAERNAW